MNHEDLTLSDVLRLIKAIEQSSVNPDVIRAIIDRVPAEPVENGRVTIGSINRLLKQTNGCTVLPEEIVAQLNAPEPVPVQPVITLPPVASPYLRLLSTNQPLMIGPTDGSKVIADAADVFTAGISGSYNGWEIKQPSVETKERPILVYELAQGATFAQMCSSLSPDLDKLCFTQHQIIEFVATHHNQLQTDCRGNFFLFKSIKSRGRPTGKIFVASVPIGSDGSLRADICQFDDPHIWSPELRHRLFVPQLA